MDKQLFISILHLKKYSSVEGIELSAQQRPRRADKFAIISEKTWTFKNWFFAMRIMEKVERTHNICIFTEHNTKEKNNFHLT